MPKQIQAIQPTQSIKAITPISGEWYAAFMPDDENDIDRKIVPLVCWSLLSYSNGEPDEVIGQIVNGDAVVEVNYVDEEEGFGSFLGYFQSKTEASDAINAAIREEARSEEDDDLEDEEEDDDGEDEEEDEGEEEDDEGDGEDGDEDEDEEDEED